MANFAQWRAVSTTLATESDKWRQIDDPARVLWLHMMLRCDNYGILEADAHIVWAHCTKRFGWSLAKASKALQALIDADLVHGWSVDEVEYLHIVNFDEHQPGEFLRKRGKGSGQTPPCQIGDMCRDHGNASTNAGPYSGVQGGSRIRREENPKTSPPKGGSSKPPAGDFAQRVFDHWVEIDVATGGGSPAGRVLNAERRKKIDQRRKEGYTVEQLQASITAFCHDAWHLGENNNKTRYTGLVTLIKTGEKVEAGLRLAEQQAIQSVNGSRYAQPQATV